MCGLVLTTASVEPHDARWRAAMDVLACRGPDSAGEVHRAEVSAGQRRLEIIGLGPAGRQPYPADESPDLLVFNGELLNYRELAAELGITPDSDTHVLYHLLHSGQIERLADLRGMFAFAYWRGDTVITGRDPFGIKPLYTSVSDDGSLSIASVPSALSALRPGLNGDPVSLAGFVASGFFPSGRSAFADVRKHEPGVVTHWHRDGLRWTPSSRSIGPGRWPHRSIGDALADSVRAHLVSDVPVGVLLSGGIDSTLIASLAADEVVDLRTYSLVNRDAPEIDEAEFARWNSRLLGTDHHEVDFDPAAALAIARDLVRTSGEPFGDAAYLPLATLCRGVRDDLKVVLAGEGADELFGGYRRYDVERPRSRRLAGGLVRTAGSLAGGLRAFDRGSPTMRTRTLASWAEPDPYLAHAYLLSGEWPTVARSPLGREALNLHRSRWPAGSADAFREFDLREWLPNVFLEKSDRASMLMSVEVRVPYLDPVVARASASLRPRDSRKRPLRDLLVSRHPAIRLPPRKMGLSVDVDRLLRTSGLDAYLRFSLEDTASVLRAEGMPDLSRLAVRSTLNPALAFRLAVLGLWQQEVLAR